MDAAEIMCMASSLGVSLRVDGDRLVARPARAVSQELRKLLQENKAELLKAISVADVADVAHPDGDKGRDYTSSDLAEMDKLLVQICELEGRDETELSALLDERRRMAPANVLKALAALRIARDEALALWPDRPTKRAEITLCELVSKRRELAVVEGKGKPHQQAKRLDSGKEAA